ncbi:polysaccharide biosynthesis/export family protein [Thalassoglobus polymorphus]|uniref:SLBB domain protein n=1 Tax=Thalassoglobus polymorphus TaxID=2527994 RepID=A0A517QKN9_9PLAN|nr:hypothetical protein [Thalassoglobus polymorphus]QDT32193.1 hypothetical protein Mal48_14350 [Thalassoglobus polymorphus]
MTNPMWAYFIDSGLSIEGLKTMSSRWYFVRLVACLAAFSLSIHQGANAQNQFAGSQSLQRSPSGMKIVEASQPQNQTHYFTIVGAVHRSGVYSADEHKVSLSRLLESAGGFASVTRPTIRVVGGGRERYRFLYNPNRESQPNVQSGEVIVVLPNPGQMTTETEIPVIPVACIGLDDRPIVLPLSTDIRTVDDLLNRLKQTQQLTDSVNILDPFGRPNTRMLAPGSVILCNPQLVDTQALSSTEAFPPAVPLTPEKNEEPLSNNEAPELESSMVVVPAPLRPSIVTPIPERPIAGPELTLTPLQSPLVSTERPALPKMEKTQVARSFEKTIPSEMTTKIAEYLSEPRQTAQTQLQSYDLPLLESESATSTSAPAPTTAPAPLPTTSISSVAPAPPEAFPVRRNQVNRGNRNQASKTGLVPTTSPQSALRKDASSSTIANSSPVVTKSETPISKRVPSIWTILPIAFAVALMGFIGFVLSVLWSRHDRRKQRNQISDTASNTRPSVDVSEEQSDLQQVSMILNRSIPMIEEEVVVPSEIHIHGEPVAQERLIHHDRHESLRGPHFAKTPQASKPKKTRLSAASTVDSAECSDETAEKNTAVKNTAVKNTAVKNTAEKMTERVHHRIDPEHAPEEKAEETVSQTEVHHVNEVHRAVVQPVKHQKLNSAYDVVEPVRDDVTHIPGGPLERALRILAQEQKS